MTAPNLSVQQRLALAKFLTEGIAKTRTDAMIPASRDEMPPGARMPAMFGGKLAAWVSMPKPTQKAAYVSDAGKLLAWVKENYPASVETATEVVTTPELIEHLREHFPSAVEEREVVDPYLVSDLCKAMKDPGWYGTADGEKVAEIPGITLPEAGEPTPTVTLTGDAGEVIGAAWRGGDIPVAELLALPGGETDAT